MRQWRPISAERVNRAGAPDCYNGAWVEDVQADVINAVGKIRW